MSGKFFARRFLLAVTAVVIASWLPASAHAVFDSGSTGADGDFNPTANTSLQLPPDGVFNFGTVNIPAGVTVTFKRNAHNTPVTILASGYVTINGSINVSGGHASGVNPGAGGPGGFDGGWGGRQGIYGYRGLRGEGPGGGGGGVYNYGRIDNNTGSGAGASFQGTGGNTGGGVMRGATYGSANLVSLIGGSGGGGSGQRNGRNGGGGGGGGGAILIASSGTITVNGGIYANGGNGGIYMYGWDNLTYPGGGGGSGGAIRLVADKIAGNGSIEAKGGGGGVAQYNWTNGAPGGYGYVRLEANVNYRTQGTNPWFSGALPSYAVYPSTLPSLKIVSIGGVPVPEIPKGDFNTPDMQLPYGTKNPVSVVVSATNIPLSTTVAVRIMGAMDADTLAVNCSALQGSFESSTTTASVNLSDKQPTELTVLASYTITAALDTDKPLYADGELVKEVRVSSALGSDESEVTYITESGKEVLARLY